MLEPHIGVKIYLHWLRSCTDITITAPNRRLQVLSIAWPIILSNISTPLLGLVDTAVIGNLGNAALIGAIAVAGVIFSFLYWGFGFLRMGTTGLVAQAIGADDFKQAKTTFYRAAGLASLIGFALILFQYPILKFALALIDGSNEVETAAATYFQIRIWSAPLNLVSLAIIGYLLGIQNSRQILLIQVVLNGTNILLDILFVVGFEWGVAGVAYATLIAEFVAFTLGILVLIRNISQQPDGSQVSMIELLDIATLRHMFAVNRDILIRTLCLIFAFALFTNQGAKSGDVLLATNAILMQFVSFAAFFLDGFALAGESMVGHAMGAKSKPVLQRVIRHVFELGIVTACALSLMFFYVGNTIIGYLTNVPEVLEASNEYLVWVILAPVTSVWCYILDGIFIGATRTKEMRNAMLVSLLIYLIAYFSLEPLLGNHGLWLSLIIYFLVRGVSLAYYLPSISSK
jgi:MATE family multidrug resistance protein